MYFCSIFENLMIKNFSEPRLYLKQNNEFTTYTIFSKQYIQFSFMNISVLLSSFIAFRHLFVNLRIFNFRLPNFVRYVRNFYKTRFVIIRFFPIHFTVTLVGLKIDFVLFKTKQRFVNWIEVSPSREFN